MKAQEFQTIQGKKVYAAAVRFINLVLDLGLPLENVKVTNFESPKGQEVVNKKYRNRAVVVIPPGAEANASKWLSFSEFGQRQQKEARLQLS